MMKHSAQSLATNESCIDQTKGLYRALWKTYLGMRTKTLNPFFSEGAMENIDGKLAEYFG